MNPVDKIVSEVANSEKVTAPLKLKASNKAVTLSSSASVSAEQFSQSTSSTGIDKKILNSEFARLDTDHDGKISSQESANALQALSQRAEKLLDTSAGELDQDEQNYLDEEDGLAFFTSMLKTLAQDEQDIRTAEQLNALLAQLQQQGLTPTLLQNTITLLTEVAPPINIKV